MRLSKPQATARMIRNRSSMRPRLGIVLGSGFHGITEKVAVERVFAYSKLPGFPPVGVSGHAGELVIGRLAGVEVAVLSGRSHFYEGYAMGQVTFAIRMLAAVGIEDLLVTNAAGGIRKGFRAGDLMAIADHINLMGTNPLIGEGSGGLPRFVDMTAAYDPGLQDLLRRASRKVPVRIRSGVYLAVSGPSYETPAEIRAFRQLGADAVGMSTVPEVIVARQCGMRVAGLSCITNLAAGCGKGCLSHAEVLETGEKVKPIAARLILNFCQLYGETR